MKKVIGVSVAAAIAVALNGCGGSSSTEDTNIGTAYYLDNAVEGVSYACGSVTGTTEEDGAFSFEKGESCTFTLAGITLREEAAENLVDGKKIVEDNVKVAQLLQSIDADGDLENGIQITPSVVEAVSKAVEALDDPEKVLEETSVMELVVEAAGGELRSEEEVVQHLAQTQTEVTKELLAGKTFYLAYIDHDIEKIEKLEVNTDATSLTWTEIKGGSESGTDPVTISGQSFFTGDEEHIIENITDKYIEVLTKDDDGDDLNRLYYSQSDAQAYLDSLGGDEDDTTQSGDTEPITKFSTEWLDGKTIYVNDKDGDEEGTRYIKVTFTKTKINIEEYDKDAELIHSRP